MPKINPRIKSIDDLLGLDAAEERPIEPTPSVSLPTKNTIITLPPQAIRAFRGHPFRLYESDRLNDLVESISEHGVLNPAIIRKIERDEDGFEYEAAPDGEHYTIDGIDCYLTNEPDKAYQFIIYDCGVMQAPTSIFRDADHRLLCGSVLPYEIPAFHKALSECGSLEVRPVAICVPQEIQEYCMELFGEDVQVAAPSHDLFAKRANGQIYRPLVEKYIAGEKRL